jgi:hypothetical protein
MTPEEWKDVVAWTRAGLDEALRSGGVAEGTTPEDEKLLEIMDRLDELHADTKPQGMEQTPPSLLADDLTNAWHGGLAPDDHVAKPLDGYEALLAELIDTAGTDPIRFEALRLHGANLIDDGTWPVPALRGFIVAVLRDAVRAPVKPGRSPEIRARNILIAAVIQDVVDEYGLTPMRNEGPSAGQSACDAVAEAMRSMRLRPNSYDRIRKLWLARDWR